MESNRTNWSFSGLGQLRQTTVNGVVTVPKNSSPLARWRRKLTNSESQRCPQPSSWITALHELGHSFGMNSQDQDEKPIWEKCFK